MELTGVVAALGPALSKMFHVRGQLGRPRTALRIDRRLISLQVPADGPTIQPDGLRHLAEGQPAISILLYSLPGGELARRGLPRLTQELSRTCCGRR
jgi:hypothetical protein